MTVKDKIINQLLRENEYSLEEKEIEINSSKLSKELSIDRSNAIDIKKKLIQSGEIVELENKKYKFTNPSKYKYNYSFLVENIDVVKEKDLSDSGLKVLGFLHWNYSKFGNPFKLGLEKIVNSVGISKNYETNSSIVEKLEELKLVQWTKGNWKEHIVGEFKLLYIDNETTPIEQETKDNELINNKDININDMEQYEERFKKMAVYCKNLENRIKELEQKNIEYEKIITSFNELKEGVEIINKASMNNYVRQENTINDLVNDVRQLKSLIIPKQEMQEN